MVTGGSGLTGRRLVEMLAERGAGRVVSFDIAAKPSDAMEHPAIEYQQVQYSQFKLVAQWSQHGEESSLL